MMRWTSAFIAVVVVFLLTAAAAHAGWDSKLEKRARETTAAFKQKDESMKPFFDKAAGYAVFPSIGKGAIGVGGASGKGVVFQGGSAIGQSRVSQITVGFQLGGQNYAQIVFFQNKQTLDSFKTGNFNFAAQATAVAASAGAGANAAYKNGVAVFTMAKGGLMYEASIGGQKFSFTPK